MRTQCIHYPYTAYVHTELTLPTAYVHTARTLHAACVHHAGITHSIPMHNMQNSTLRDANLSTNQNALLLRWRFGY